MTTGTDLAVKPGKKTFDYELAKMGEQFDRTLPAHLPLERFERCVRNAVAANPKLLECTRVSLWNAAMTAAVLGVECDGGPLGQGYLIPFKGKVQFIPGYKGLTMLALHSGFLVEGVVVRALDEFDYERGLTPRLFHKPANRNLRGDDNPILGAYATARSKPYPDAFEYMEMVDIIRVRDRSAGWKAKGEASTWGTDFAAMVRKTPIRLLANHLPLTVQKAVGIELLYDRGQASHAVMGDDGVIDIVPEPIEPEEDEPDAMPETYGDEDYAKADKPAGYQFDTERMLWVRYGVGN